MSLAAPHSSLCGGARATLGAPVFAGVLAALVTASTALAGPAFLGNWARGDGKTHIRVEPCGAAFCGVNTWVSQGDSGEKVGDRLIAHVKPAGTARWSGNAFDPQRNRRYSMLILVANRRMTTEGCVFGGMMCQSMRWTRLGPAQ
jgi:uncharacterized protein (DUF2147 family)